ncbi:MULTISPECIES: TonB-dependent receptor plug domain-containing protein [Providencia]|uniref:TonB-dependent receptor plug domain-containing protein n=1 Tax=Providencia TaxID=586 RepID=UPI000839110B|nr:MULTISPECIES: TonB-dependent receptor [Providencia]MBP6121682.1 TonB-dependent receptor [Providencia sp.]NIH20768.1 TonB-dependent receptor [Providencia heimbachae]
MNAAIKGKLLISTLALFVSQTVFAAQTVPETNLSEKNDIMVVTTNRLGSSLWNSPATIQVIDKQELDNSTNTLIADDLQDIPGVEITDNALAGRKQIRIRGEASSRVLILIDGQEVTYQRAGQDFGAGLLIDESSLERIEVVKGPYSVLYGSQAIGGVVNFITKKRGDKPFGGALKAVYSSATKGWDESAAAWGSVGNFDYRLNGSYSDQGDRDTPDGHLKNTNHRNNSQGLWLGYTLDKHKFGLSVDRYKLTTQTWYDDPSYEHFSVKIPDLTREKVGLFYDYAIEGDYLKNIHVDAYQQTIERDFKNEVAVNTPTGSPMIGNLRVTNQTHSKDKQYTQGVTLQSNLTLPFDNQLIVGAQYQRDRVKQASDSDSTSASSTKFPPAVNYTKSTQTHNRTEQTNWSLFAQNDYAFADNWKWTLGARQYWLNSELTSGNENIQHSMTGSTYRNLDNSKTNDNQFIASSSLRYSGFENTELRLAFAQGYVFPTLSQLFMQTSAGGSINYGNTDLKAEHSNNYEIGARYNGNQWYLDSALYYSEAKDYIASVACSGQSVCNGNTNTSRTGYYYYDNIDRAKTYGLELTAEYHGWDIAPYVSGNYLRRQFDGVNIKTWDTGEPALTGRVGAKHTLLFDQVNLTSDLFVRAASHAKNNTNDKATNYAGWATLNLAFNTEFGIEDQYQFNLSLNNLTNKKYQTAHESIPAAGFNTAAGFVWKF